MERELPIMADLRRLADSLSEKDETMRAAADVIGAMDGDLSEQKAAHRDCIKRNIALAAENSSLRSELDEARRALEDAGELAAAVISNFGDMEDGDGNLAPEIRMAKRLVRTVAAIRQKGERS